MDRGLFRGPTFASYNELSEYETYDDGDDRHDDCHGCVDPGLGGVVLQLF